MNNKKQKIIIIMIIFGIILLISGSTFAYLQWASLNTQKTNVTFTSPGQGFTCSADGGGNITDREITLAPSLCTNSVAAIKREITTNVISSRSTPISLDMWLDIKKLTQGLSDSQYFSYALTDSPDGCTSGRVLSSGTFYGAAVNDKINILYDDTYLTSGSKTYYLYIWLDAEEEEDFTMDQEFDLELGGQCIDKYYTPNAPDVVDGLIPVKLSNTGDTVTTVAENDSTWYNYYDKKWANAVLVKEEATEECATCHDREYYQTNTNVPVDQNDILAYYVWIPRYSYKVWQYEGVADTPQEHSIDIKFTSPGMIEIATGNGEWYTHPAFWWDNDSDGVRDPGEELSGIWVGKFETSHETLSSSTTSDNLGCSSSGCATYDGLRILPNVSSLRYNSRYNFFHASRAMESTGNPFGLNSTTVDSHMMKNREWGAVAYLSHSKYGINGAVRINNQNTYTTGCGAATVNAAADGNCGNKYADVVTTFPQSTTGNVTGIFDMSGGAYEYAFSVRTSPSQSILVTSFPDKKYYDFYSTSISEASDFSICALEYCGGHALNETKTWYGAQCFPLGVYTESFVRGGMYSSETWGGIFSYAGVSGASPLAGFRLVLIKDSVPYEAPPVEKK